MWSYSCLRWCVGFISIVSMIFGIVGLALGGHLLSREDLSALDIRDLIAYSFLVMGGLFFVTGFCGCYGAKAKSGCCGFFFAMFFSLLSLALIAMGAAMLIFYDKFEDEVKGGDCDTGNLQSINDGGKDSFSLFCSAGCVCDGTFADYSDLDKLGKADDVTFYQKNADGAATAVQHCSSYNEWKTHGDNTYVEDNLDFFKSVEKEFNCSGICTEYPYYLFSGIDRTPAPEGNCVDKILDKVRDLAKAYGGVSIGVGIIFFLFSICGYCMACHPDRKQSHQNFV